MGLWNVLPALSAVPAVHLCVNVQYEWSSSQVWVRLSSRNGRRWCTEVPLPSCLKESWGGRQRVTRRKVQLIGLAASDTTIAAICPWCDEHARVALSVHCQPIDSHKAETNRPRRSYLRSLSISVLVCSDKRYCKRPATCQWKTLHFSRVS